jgi:hypothetical protein
MVAALGKALYPGKNALLITADGGGSNGVRNRLWKKMLQAFANEEQLAIMVVHYPPATSKWNKIEHRLFSFISINWRAKPLTSLEVVLELISHTTTKESLTVTALKDSHIYSTGRKVTDEELAALHLRREEFHGEWNYTILPQASSSSGQLISALLLRNAGNVCSEWDDGARPHQAARPTTR